MICEALPSVPFVARTEIAGPGFINFRIKPSYLGATLAAKVVRSIHSRQEARARPVSDESAGPRPPLLVG